jgi:prepilin peptidase CpaA
MPLFLTAFHVAIIAVSASVFIAAAINDAYTYRIPNYMCGLLLALFPLFVATAPRSFDWHQHLMVFGLVAASGFAMFLGGLAGAGDIKLLSVASLWAGPHLIAVLLIVTAIAGGLVPIAMAIITHLRHRKIKEPTVFAKIPIPYGIAIATGGLAVLGMIVQPIFMP